MTSSHVIILLCLCLSFGPSCVLSHDVFLIYTLQLFPPLLPALGWSCPSNKKSRVRGYHGLLRRTCEFPSIGNLRGCANRMRKGSCSKQSTPQEKRGAQETLRGDIRDRASVEIKKEMMEPDDVWEEGYCKTQTPSQSQSREWDPSQTK